MFVLSALSLIPITSHVYSCWELIIDHKVDLAFLLLLLLLYCVSYPLMSLMHPTGIRAHWLYAGVSNINGKKKFFYSKEPSEAEHNEWGLHAVNPDDHYHTPPSPQPQAGDQLNTVNTTAKTAPVPVPVMEEFDVVRLVDLFQSHIRNRVIPNSTNIHDPPPAVVMKIDIEGEEYVVLQDLLTAPEKPLCHVRAFSVEFHSPVAIKNAKKPVKKPKNNTKVQTMLQDLEQYQHKNNCPFEVILFDTEKYNNDSAGGKVKLSQWCHRLQFLMTTTPKYCLSILAEKASISKHVGAGGSLRSSKHLLRNSGAGDAEGKKMRTSASGV